MNHALEKLQDNPSQKTVRLATCISLAATFIVLIIMYPYTASTIAAGAPSVIDFELTWGGARTQEILAIWSLGELKNGQLILNLIDFAYMPSYAFFIGGAVLWTARMLPDGRQKKFGFFASLLPFVAWAWDFVENVNLIQMFVDLDNATDVVAITASIAATIKFIALILAIGAFSGHLIKLAVMKVKHNPIKEK